MRYAILSDLHVGDPGSAALGPDFHKFLDHLEETHDEIILLGDTFETLFPVLPWGAAQELQRIRQIPAFARFFSPPYTLVYGNHDRVLKEECNSPASIDRESDQWRIHLLHGHELEPIFRNRVSTFLSELYMWAAFRLKLVGLPALFNLGYAYDRRQNMDSGGAHQVEFADSAIVRNGYNVVVMGHIHIARHVVFPSGAHFLNCGDCLSRMMYASIDTRSQQASLVEFRDGQTIRIPPELRQSGSGYA